MGKYSRKGRHLPLFFRPEGIWGRDTPSPRPDPTPCTSLRRMVLYGSFESLPPFNGFRHGVWGFISFIIKLKNENFIKIFIVLITFWGVTCFIDFTFISVPDVPWFIR